MWDWLTGNLRRRSRRRADTGRTITEISGPVDLSANVPQPPSISGCGLGSFFRRTRETTQPFFIPACPVSESPPKCLSRLPCSQILYGERVEDFSSDCWLEDHLHQFGFPSDRPTQTRPIVRSPVFEESDDSITSTIDTTSDNFDLIDDDDRDSLPTRPRLALEELFAPLGESDTDIDRGYDMVDIDPPPYSEFDPPPPSYEEAVGADRRSMSSRSTSSSLAFMW